MQQKKIILSKEVKAKIIKHFEYLKHFYATDANEYAIINSIISDINDDSLTRRKLRVLHDIKNGPELLKMLIKDANNYDMSDYIEI